MSIGALRSGRRFYRFASVGAVGAAIDLSISSALTLAGGVSPVLAKVVGAEVAIVAMFLLNDRWTYPNAGGDGLASTVGRFCRSNLVRVGGVGVQALVVWALTRGDYSLVLAGTDVWPTLTMPVAIACSFAVNYVAETLFTWRLGR